MFSSVGEIISFTVIGTILYDVFWSPIYLKYKKKQTLISENQVDFNQSKPPAITVLAWRKHNEAGWKEKSKTVTYF